MGNRGKVILFCSYFLSACSNNKQQQDEFYCIFQNAHWDIVPLIKPYAVWGNSPFYENGMWVMGRADFPFESIQDVKYVSVRDSIIYVLTGVVGTVDSAVPKTARIGNYMHYTAWFVVDLKRNIEKEFSSEAQFKEYLDSNGYQSPHWLEIDSLSKELDMPGTQFPWWPKS